MTRVEAFLVLPVAALHLAVVPGCVWTDEFMPDTQLSGGFLKKSGDISFAVREAISKLKAIIGLNALYTNAPAGIPLHQPLQEISRGVRGLLRIGGQKAQTGKLVNSGILEQAKLRIRDTASGNDFHIHLDTLPGIGHLLIGLWCIGLLCLLAGKHSQLPHDTKQALRMAGIA